MNRLFPSETNAVKFFVAESVFIKHLPEIIRAPIALRDGKIFSVQDTHGFQPAETLHIKRGPEGINICCKCLYDGQGAFFVIKVLQTSSNKIAVCAFFQDSSLNLSVHYPR